MKSESYSKKAMEHFIKRKPDFQMVYNLRPKFDLPVNAKISKKYLYADEISNYDELPEELGSGALNSLNEKHDYTLRWKLLESKVTDTDILELEKRIQIKIPNVLKDYLQSYALPLPFITGTISADVSETYCEETDKWRTLEFEDEFATATLRLAPMPLNYELLVFENLNKYFINRRYIYFGTFNNYEYIFLDTMSGFPMFDNFEDLLKCFFFGEVYDMDYSRYTQKGSLTRGYL